MLTLRSYRLAPLGLLAALAAAAALAPAASAATPRYASPTGTGFSCTSASPCSLYDAIGGAVAGDEVIVTPGDYKLSSTLNIAKPVTIHGVAGKPRPRLLFDAGVKGMDLELGSTLRYVELDARNNEALFVGRGATIDQVIARAPGDAVAAVAMGDATMRNSIAVASGTNAAAIDAASGVAPLTTATIRNVTAVASGTGATVILARATAQANLTVNVSNTIAYGGSTALPVYAVTDNSGAAATMNVTHSVYSSWDVTGILAKIVDGGGNHYQTPAFVDAAKGDYREAPSSYTINAGLDALANGAFDVDGGARVIGTTDIGADEYLAAPVASTGPAGAITTQSAALGGSVNPKGAPTSYHFQYGPTTAYGSATASTGAGSGKSAVAAGATLAGLSPARTYHYRIVATSVGGVAKGADRTFTTAAVTTPPPAQGADRTFTTAAVTTPPPAQPFAGVRLLSTRLTMARRSITVRLSCPSGTVGRCSGLTKLTTRRRRTASHPAATVRLGRKRLSIAAGQQARVRVRVSREGRRLLRRVGHLRGKDTTAARDGAGVAKTTVARVRIRRRHQ